jgi:hypothetical protein
MRWGVRFVIMGAELLFFWVIIVVCVGGSMYSIYQMVIR